MGLNCKIISCSLLVVIGLSICLTPMTAQDIDFVSSKWSDSFREWLFLDAEEEEIGYLKIKWDLSNDFTDWEFVLNDLRGSIKTKWKDDPNNWEMIIEGEFLTARPVFPKDYSSWKIKYNNTYYTFRQTGRYDWSIDREDFRFKSSFGGDPKDWYIEGDYGAVNNELQIFTIFLALYHSLPSQ